MFGESAGAGAISFHMVSEMSKGLFHKVILMSGTMYSPWSIRSVFDWSQRLGKQLGWDGEGGDKACFKVIQSASAENITRAQEKVITLEVFFCNSCLINKNQMGNMFFIVGSYKIQFTSIWTDS